MTPVLAVVSIDYVTVGNHGNAADPSTGYGSVSYTYNIGKYEVTNSQYAAFLNAKGTSNIHGIYDVSMYYLGITQTGGFGNYTYNVQNGFENKPVVYISWFSAARFSNWINNGQGAGDTETGAYTLNGASAGIITKNVGATVWIPTENEWYKAAYYNGNSATYSIYPNQSNSITIADANYYPGVLASTDVGSYSEDPSFYGTFDQGGNVLEFNDAVVGSSRGMRGGSYTYDKESAGAGVRNVIAPTQVTNDLGFRVASIPEVRSIILTVIASVLALGQRKR